VLATLKTEGVAMGIHRLGTAALGLVTATMGLAVIAGPADAGAGAAGAALSCKIQGIRSGYGVFEAPDVNSTRFGFVYQYTYPFECIKVEGVEHNVCGGGTTYYEVVVDGRPGYTPKACFTETTT
jgi:hypothetical protein